MQTKLFNRTMKKITTKILLLIFPFLGFGQQQYIPDHLVKNQLNEFLLGFEVTLNGEDAFDKNDPFYRLGDFFFSEDVTVYNDLDAGKEYLTLNEYQEIAKNLSANCFVGFNHYNLTLKDRNEYKYYDVIIASVTREVVIACEDKETVKTSHIYDITLVYNKYLLDKTSSCFKILRIDKENSSYKPDTWYKNSIPDEVFLKLAPDYSSPALKQSNHDIQTESQRGFHGSVGVNYLLTGWEKDIITVSAGVGYSKKSSQFNLNNYSASFDTIDQDGDMYSKEVYGTNIRQVVDFSTVDIPVMFSWKHLLSNKWQVSLSTGVKASFIFDQKYKTNDGSFEYQGLYQDLYGQQFYFYDLPSYGFTDFNSYNQKNSPELNSFFMSWESALHANYQIDNGLGFFFGPSVSMGLSSLTSQASENFILSRGEGVTDPLVNLTDEFKMTSIGFEVGLTFSINNIRKPFIQNPRFRNEQRIAGKNSQDDFANNLFNNSTPTYTSKEKYETRKIKINKLTNSCYPALNAPIKTSELLYNVTGLDGYMNAAKSPGGSGKIKIPVPAGSDGQLSGMINICKPFNYNVASDHASKFDDIGKALYSLPISDTATSLELVPLTPLHVFIFNMNSIIKGLSPRKNEIYDIYCRIMEPLVEQHDQYSCYTYFWNENITGGKQADGLSDGCLKCREDFGRGKVKFTQLDNKDDTKNLYEDLKSQIGEQLSPGRRTIVFHFLIVDIPYARALLQGQLDELMAKLGDGYKNVAEINLYFDLDNINALKEQGNEAPIENFEAIKYLQETGLKSIKLKNINIHPLK